MADQINAKKYIYDLIKSSVLSDTAKTDLKNLVYELSLQKDPKTDPEGFKLAALRLLKDVYNESLWKKDSDLQKEIDLLDQRVASTDMVAVQNNDGSYSLMPNDEMLAKVFGVKPEKLYDYDNGELGWQDMPADQFKRMIERSFGKGTFVPIMNEMYKRQQARNHRAIIEGYDPYKYDSSSKFNLGAINPIDWLGSAAMGIFTPRRKEAYIRGEDPSWKDLALDVGENALQFVPMGPAIRGAKALGKIPVGKALANTPVGKALASYSKEIGENAIVPTVMELADAVAYDEGERSEISPGDVVTGTGVNFATPKVIKGVAEGIGRKISGFGKSKATDIMDKIRDVADDPIVANEELVKEAKETSKKGWAPTGSGARALRPGEYPTKNEYDKALDALRIDDMQKEGFFDNTIAGSNLPLSEAAGPRYKEMYALTPDKKIGKVDRSTEAKSAEEIAEGMKKTGKDINERRTNISQVDDELLKAIENGEGPITDLPSSGPSEFDITLENLLESDPDLARLARKGTEYSKDDIGRLGLVSGLTNKLGGIVKQSDLVPGIREVGEYEEEKKQKKEAEERKKGIKKATSAPKKTSKAPKVSEDVQAYLDDQDILDMWEYGFKPNPIEGDPEYEAWKIWNSSKG